MKFHYKDGMYLEMNAFGGRGGPHRALAFMPFRLDALYKFMQGQKGLDALAEAARAIRLHVKRMRIKWVQLGRTFPKYGAGLTEEDMLQSGFEPFENGVSTSLIFWLTFLIVPRPWLCLVSP